MLSGKGMYIWKIRNAEHGDIVEIVGKAKVAGMTHLMIKIADGIADYNYTNEHGDMAKNLADECHRNGIEPWGWQYIFGNQYNPSKEEAQKAFERIQDTGVVGFVIDAEGEYKGEEYKAEVYANELSSLLPSDFPVGLASYRYPVKYHDTLPWKTFLEVCDFAMPQTYWAKGDPVANLHGMLADYEELWNKIGFSLPIIPTGAAYNENDWTATAQEVESFLSECEALGLPGVNFWEWAEMKENNLWHTIRDYPWPETEVPEPPAEDSLELLKEDLNALEEKVADIDQAVFDLTTRIDEKIANNRDLISNLDNTTSQLFNNHDERIIENKAQNSALQTRLEEMKAWVKEAKSSLIDLKSQDEMLNKNLSSVIDAHGGFKKEANNRFSDLMNKDGRISKRISSEVEKLEEKINNISDCNCEGCSCNDQETGFLNCLKRLFGIG